MVRLHDDDYDDGYRCDTFFFSSRLPTSHIFPAYCGIKRKWMYDNLCIIFECQDLIVSLQMIKTKNVFDDDNIGNITYSALFIVSFTPYFRLLFFGILVTLVVWFSFRFFPSCPSCLAKCKQRLCNIFVTSSPKVTKNQQRKMGWTKHFSDLIFFVKIHNSLSDSVKLGSVLKISADLSTFMTINMPAENN